MPNSLKRSQMASKLSSIVDAVSKIENLLELYSPPRTLNLEL
jgi:hypothetical protein